MTDKYKRINMHWCDYCQVWMANNSVTIATHDRGTKHQAAVARKLHDMRKTADDNKAKEQRAKESMAEIELKAREQYAKDKKEAAAAKAALGKWELDDATGYHYNEMQRYYFDTKSGMYYGGEPAEWTSSPPIPTGSLYTSNPTPPQPTASVASPQAASTQPGARVVTRVIKVPKHPMAGIGGYQMPTTGIIGGAKQLGAVGPVGGGQRGNKVLDLVENANVKCAPVNYTSPQPGEKRGRESNRPVSKEEAEALARREAARRRVEARTKQSFGFA